VNSIQQQCFAHLNLAWKFASISSPAGVSLNTSNHDRGESKSVPKDAWQQLGTPKMFLPLRCNYSPFYGNRWSKVDFQTHSFCGLAFEVTILAQITKSTNHKKLLKHFSVFAMK